MVVPLPHRALTAAILYGKLPAHGDFIARNLGAGERAELDGWLAESLSQARVALGDAFDELYDQALPWRFARKHGAGWTAGAMAPSVDGVGRRYPIVLARVGLDEVMVEPTAEAMEALIYEALGQRWDADRLFGAASATEPASAEIWTAGDRWWFVDEEGIAEQSIAGAHPPLLINAVLQTRSVAS